MFVRRLAAALLIVLIGGCAHHPNHPPPSQPSTESPRQAGVGFAAVGSRGAVLPVVDREPFIVSRGQARADQPITLTWQLSAKEPAEVSVRILRYQKVDLAQIAPADAFKSLAKAAPFCPLADPKAAESGCSCASKGGEASCTFRTSETAVFSYDICVKRRGDERASCLDPFGIIN